MEPSTNVTAEQQDALRLAHARERRLYGHLTRHLPDGWRGKTMAELLAMPDGPGRLQAVLNEALGWCNGVADRMAEFDQEGAEKARPGQHARCMPGCDGPHCAEVATGRECPRWSPAPISDGPICGILPDD